MLPAKFCFEFRREKPSTIQLPVPRHSMTRPLFSRRTLALLLAAGFAAGPALAQAEAAGPAATARGPPLAL